MDRAQEYELLIPDVDNSIRINKPDDTIIVKLRDQRFTVDVIEYLNKKQLNALADEYGINTSDERKRIERLKLAIRGIKKVETTNYCEIALLVIVSILLITVALLLTVIFVGYAYYNK